MDNERWIVIVIIKNIWYLKMYPNNLKIPACFRNHFESKLGVEAFISHLFKKLIQINREIKIVSAIQETTI